MRWHGSTSLLVTDNNGAAPATSGTWDTTTADWGLSSALTTFTYDFPSGGTAVFTSSVGNTNILTINSAITFGGITNNGTSSTNNNNTFTTTGSGSLVLNPGSPAASTTVYENTGTCNDTFLLPITGTGALSFTGSGSVFLFDTNTYSGGTYLNRTSGVNFDNNSSFGTGPIIWGNQLMILATPTSDASGNTGATGPITIANAMQATAQEVIIVHTGIPLTFTGPWTLPSSGTAYWSDAGTTTINGVISGSAQFELGGAGNMSLNGVNTSWTGGFLQHSGNTVNYNNNSSFGTGTITIGAGGGAFANSTSSAITIHNNFVWSGANSLNLVGGLPVAGAPGTTFTGTVGLGANQATIYTGGSPAGIVDEFTGVISGTGGINTDDNGILELAGVNTFTGPITVGVSLGGKTPTLAIVGAGSLHSGSYAGSINNATGATFLYNSSAAQTLSGVISGAGAFIQSGGNTTTLSGANTMTGLITVNGGLLAVAADNNLGAVPGSAVANAITLNGGLQSGLRITASTNFNVNRGITLGANGGEIQIASGKFVTNNSVITGGGAFQMGQNSGTGLGTLQLTAVETYTGKTIIACGTLQLASGASIASSSGILMSNAMTLDVSAQSAFALSGNNASFTSISTGTANKIIGAPAGNVGFGSTLVNLSFVPTATTGDLTHPALTITAGTLQLSGNTINVTNASALTLGAGTYTLISQTTGSISLSGSPDTGLRACPCCRRHRVPRGQRWKCEPRDKQLFSTAVHGLV